MLPLVKPAKLVALFVAVQIGRYIDRGHDAQAAWIGSALVLVASAGLWAWSGSPALLLAFTVVLGTGHMYLMASQQMLVVRGATARLGRAWPTLRLGRPRSRRRR